MIEENFQIIVHHEDEADAGRFTQALIDSLREIDGVLDSRRIKSNDETMDLGTIVSVIATSGATLAIAQGLAAWLQARRGATVTVEKSGSSGSLKAAVTGIDPRTAERIVEMIRSG